MVNGGGVSLIVLAGGRSRRMGTEKADLQYRDKSFLNIQVAKALELQIPDVIISGYRGKQLPLPLPGMHLRVIPDQNPEKGPLGGLETCLRAVEQDWALVLPVDAPLVPAAELRRLMEFALSGAHRAVILQCGDNQHPLIGMYHKSLAPAMLEEFTQRKGSVFALLRRVGFGIYESPADEALFANINDRSSYETVLGENYVHG